MRPSNSPSVTTSPFALTRTVRPPAARVSVPAWAQNARGAAGGSPPPAATRARFDQDAAPMLPPAHPPWPLVDPILDRALEEDLAGGDVTTESCVEPHVRAKAALVARGDVVVCGVEIARRTFEKLARDDVRFEGETREGTRAGKGDVLLRVEASARALLMAERV